LYHRAQLRSRSIQTFAEVVDDLQPVVALCWAEGTLISNPIQEICSRLGQRHDGTAGGDSTKMLTDDDLELLHLSFVPPPKHGRPLPYLPPPNHAALAAANSVDRPNITIPISQLQY
jgi:hypothetical protein